MTIYLFFRSEGGFYPLELSDDQAARHNAETNPGTTRVETLAGRIVWQDNNRLN